MLTRVAAWPRRSSGWLHARANAPAECSDCRARSRRKLAGLDALLRVFARGFRRREVEPRGAEGMLDDASTAEAARDHLLDLGAVRAGAHDQCRPSPRGGVFGEAMLDVKLPVAADVGGRLSREPRLVDGARIEECGRRLVGAGLGDKGEAMPDRERD